MKKYLSILAYYTGIIIVTPLVGTLLALYVLAHFPWMATTSMMILIVCLISWVDYRRTSRREGARTHH